jgi:Phosphotransferase enzyme family
MTFDPALGDLSVVIDPAAAATVLTAAFDGSTVRSPRRRDTKYRPLERCEATYDLELVALGGTRRRSIGVVTVTVAGVAARRFDDDPGLPSLAEALDPERMAARLAGPVPGLTGCAPSPVRYKPGARCVLRYRLTTRTGPRELFGKLLAGGVDAQLATVAALRAAAGGEGMPAVLPVTAAWPDLGLLVQPAVEGGAELHERAFDPAVPETERLRMLGSAGHGLAALHGADLPGVPSVTHADDLAELRGYLAPVGQLDPALGERYAAVLDRVEAAGGAGAAQPVAAGHGAMRTDQFLIDGEGGGLVLIDLDGVCLAEPARDLGNLLAYLDWKAIRRPTDAAWVERVGAAFLAGYATGRSVAADRVAVYRAGSLLKIAGRRYRSLTVPEWPLVPALVDAASTTVTGGLSP